MDKSISSRSNKLPNLSSPDTSHEHVLCRFTYKIIRNKKAKIHKFPSFSEFQLGKYTVLNRPPPQNQIDFDRVQLF